MAKEQKRTAQMTRKPMIFSALDRSWEDNIVRPTETVSRGRDMVSWGDGNAYPQYLHDLYMSVPTLQSVVNGTVDYVKGDGVVSDIPANAKGQEIGDILDYIAHDLVMYNGFALNVIRNRKGEVAGVYHLDFKRVRSDKKNTVFWYSESWDRWTSKALRYPAFRPDGKEESSVLYAKYNGHTQTYPYPIYGASDKACEILKEVDVFHLNNIKNGFSASYIINLLNGIPDDSLRAEIEDEFIEKFTGSQNSGRFVLNFADSKEHSSEIQTLDVSDFDKKYESLAKWSRTQIFTSFKANPNLFGISTENIGFSAEEYKQSFKLFSKTTVEPYQNFIVKNLKKVFPSRGFEIKQFVINWES